LAKGLGRGGAEQLLVSCAAHLDTSRYELDVAYLLPWKDALVPQLEAHGATVHCLGQTSGRDLRWVGRLERLLRTRDYDLVHTHMPVPAAAARLLRPGRKPAFVHTEHNVWSRYHRATYWANALTYWRNQAVIAVSDAVGASIEQRWLRRGVSAEVMHHGIEITDAVCGAADRARARVTLGLPADAFAVGTVGNLTPKKDHRTLLDACASALSDVPNLRLVVIGSGPLEADLHSYVNERGLADVVLLAGSRGDVPDLLPAFDIFAMSSRYEGLPIALMEAMAAGLPSVLTAVGGIPEMVTNGVEGLLVPAGHSADMAAGITRLARDGQFRAEMAAAAQERGRTFDIRNATKRIWAIYDNVSRGVAA
jgi:glycosyltransferase involved in cell wall biosynthesis